MLKVKFCGAARTVTGSQYYLEYKGQKGDIFRFCLDSGLFQAGQKINLFKINSHLLFDPRKLDCIILTHAHLDHCGRLPFLVKHGFGGKIFTTKASAQIASVVMADAARLNTSISENQPLKGIRQKIQESGLVDVFDGIPEIEDLEKDSLGLYSSEDVEETIRRFQTFEYHQKFRIHPELEVEFYDAGHILGSSFVVINQIQTGKKIIFSGDLGNIDKPIIDDPQMPNDITGITHVFTETTYGNRSHGSLKPKEKLRKSLYQTLSQNGLVLLPSFSVERAQEVIYYISELMSENKIPQVPIFLDSPMASKILQITLEHPELYDQELEQKIRNKTNPLINKHIKILETSRESMKLNHYDKPCIIIAGSGMLTGGRILKHIQYHLENPSNLLLMVGYQAHGTLGRLIFDGAKKIEVEGREFEVLAKVENITEFSAHADQDLLKKWLGGFVYSQKQHEQTIFLMHGEKEASLGLQKELNYLFPKLNTYWPRFGEEVILWQA